MCARLRRAHTHAQYLTNRKRNRPERTRGVQTISQSRNTRTEPKARIMFILLESSQFNLSRRYRKCSPQIFVVYNALSDTHKTRWRVLRPQTHSEARHSPRTLRTHKWLLRFSAQIVCVCVREYNARSTYRHTHSHAVFHIIVKIACRVRDSFLIFMIWCKQGASAEHVRNVPPQMRNGSAAAAAATAAVCGCHGSSVVCRQTTQTHAHCKSVCTRCCRF